MGCLFQPYCPVKQETLESLIIDSVQGLRAYSQYCMRSRQRYVYLMATSLRALRALFAKPASQLIGANNFCGIVIKPSV